MTEKLTPATDEEIAAFIAECQEWTIVPTPCVWPLRLILKMEADAEQRAMDAKGDALDRGL